MNYEPNSLVAKFLESSQKYYSKIAVNFENKQISYSELCQEATTFAAALHAWGFQPGERVALFLENTPQFIIAYLGTHLAKGVVVLVNTQYQQVELRHILNDASVRLCVTDSARFAALEKLQAAGELPGLEAVILIGEPGENTSSSLRHQLWQDFLVGASAFEFDYTENLPNGEDLAIIAYTSGTTGRSKGAMLLHRNLLANAQAVVKAWEWTASDHLLLTLPLFHAHGLMVGLHGTLVAGASLELCRHFQAQEVFGKLLTGRFSMFFGVPTMYTRLLAEAARQSLKPSPLRLYVSGSAPLSQQTFEEFKAVFGQSILERYGMTETIMNLTNPYRGERRAGSVGLPFPGQEARVVQVQNREPVLPGEPGEIEVRGPHVFAGYWQNPQASAESFTADGWFRTGDLGFVSRDGYFTINGRAKELIISGGYNIYPREIEEVLQSCPGVGEVAVLGLPDPDFGEQVVAVIVKNDPTLSAGQVIEFCREQLATYKKPRQVVFVDSLPRNALGKIQKHLLKDELA